MSYNHQIYIQQIGLKTLGFDPGPADGVDGPRTRRAFSQSEKARFGDPTPKGYPPRPDANAKSKRQVFGFEGIKNGRSPKMGYFTPPYAMRFSWGGKVKRIGCHHLIVEPLSSALEEIAKKGEAWIKKHGLDLYAGCYNPRKSRVGNSISDHSWAIAIDLNPDANGLRTQWKPGKKASNGTLQMPKEAVRIFRKYGFQVGFSSKGGRRDMMHIAYMNRS